MPDGRQIVDSSAFAASVVWSEIFERRLYARHGIEIRDGDLVVDAGANVGLFCLWLNSLPVRDLKILSFEPVPRTFEALEQNTRHIPAVERYNLAIGSLSGRVIVQSCPRLTQASGVRQWSVAKEDVNLRHAEAGVASHWLGRLLPHFIQKLVARRVLRWHRQTEAVVCPVTSWTDFAASYKVNDVGLFKIDVEGMEIDVLKGITDFSSIRQFVIEAHSESMCSVVERLLKAAGYRVVVDRDADLPMVYARR